MTNPFISICCHDTCAAVGSGGAGATGIISAGASTATATPAIRAVIVIR